mmetsp:Transcript_7589/g.19650  ORF Transcript_7589/g.19650 Transcript_7589/m.19650 type:complete len:88 (-) Transcript_7589:9-272(-)
MAANIQALVERLRGPDRADQASAALAEQAKAEDADCTFIAAAGALPLLVALLRAGTEEAENVASLLVQLTTEMQLEDSSMRAEISAL